MQELRIRILKGGYRYLWLKTVEDFDPSKHCAASFRGRYHSGIPRPAQPCAEFTLDLDGSVELHYLCGVVNGNRWAENLHIGMRLNPAAEPWRAIDDRIEVESTGGIEVLPIYPVEAREERKEFTTCRNWQFGMIYFNQARRGVEHSERAFWPAGRFRRLPV